MTSELAFVSGLPATSLRGPVGGTRSLQVEPSAAWNVASATVGTGILASVAAGAIQVVTRRRRCRGRCSAAALAGAEPTLSSDLNLDYSKLRDLLQAGDFKAADAETRSLLIKMSGEGAIKRGWIYFAEVKRIPETDMETLESLWQYFSEGKFGFCAQRKIWRSVRGQFDKFAEQTSWFTDTWKNRNWPDEFVYSLEAPVGHLPLTNCIRGAQVLEELLNHPVIVSKKAITVEQKPIKAPEPEKPAASDTSSEDPAPKRKSALSMLAMPQGQPSSPSTSYFVGHRRRLQVVPLRAVAASEAPTEVPVTSVTTLESLKEFNVINENGFVLPELPDSTAASVFVLYDAQHQAQYLGFSKDLRNSLRTLLCRRPELCYHYKCLHLQEADNAQLLEVRTAWASELGDLPAGNRDPRQKLLWESAVDAGAVSERAFRTVAEQKAKQILRQLKDRGLKEPVEFKDDLIAQGKVDPMPSTLALEAVRSQQQAVSSRTRKLELKVAGKQVEFEVFYVSEFDTKKGGSWFDVEITASKMKSTHRVILGQDFVKAVGASSPHEVVEKAFAFVLARNMPRRTEGVITSEVFPVNYFTVTEFAVRFPDFLNLFEKISPDFDFERMQWNFKQVNDYRQDDKRTISTGPNGGFFDPAALQ